MICKYCFPFCRLPFARYTFETQWHTKHFWTCAWTCTQNLNTFMKSSYPVFLLLPVPLASYRSHCQIRSCKCFDKNVGWVCSIPWTVSVFRPLPHYFVIVLKPGSVSSSFGGSFFLRLPFAIWDPLRCHTYFRISFSISAKKKKKDKKWPKKWFW